MNLGHDCQRIGHGGASALAPANTLASFDAAIEVGVDMVEFDVRAHRGELILAHTMLDARRRQCVSLSQALSHLSSRRFSGIGINLDVKDVGCERRLLDAVRHMGMLNRALISSQVALVLDRVRLYEPRASTAISVGGRIARLSRRWLQWRTQVLAGLASGRWDGLMAQHRLIDRTLVQDVSERGGRLCAWTVNEREMISALRNCGVHGITTADPRLFTAPVATDRTRGSAQV